MRKVYVAHPLRGGTSDFQVITENMAQADRVLIYLSKEYPDILFLSPIHAFSFVSALGPQEWVLEQCLALLDLADELWVFGDWYSSEVCTMEIEHARKLGIEVLFFDNGMSQEATS